MNNTSRFSALLAYILPVIGWAYVAIARKNDQLAMHHTRQAITVFLVAFGTFAAWLVIGLAISLVPFFGFIIMVASFSLVMIILFAMVINWIIGIVYVSQAKMDPLPVTGNLIGAFATDSVKVQQKLYREMVEEAEMAGSIPDTGYSVDEAKVRLIGFNRRFAAIVVDVTFIIFITSVMAISFSFLAWFIGAFKPYSDVVPFTNLAIILGILISVGYYTYFWTKSGQTIGKTVAGIKVISADGSPLTWGQSFMRYIGYIVSGFLFSLGFLWVIMDKRRQGWHDKIAKTYVVDEDDSFLNARSVDFSTQELGRERLWLVLWIIIALFGPVGALSGLWVLGPFINNFITGLFQGGQ